MGKEYAKTNFLRDEDVWSMGKEIPKRMLDVGILGTRRKTKELGL